MKLNMKIDLGDGPFIVATNLQTIVAWERKFKRKASDMSSGIGVEDLAFLAWECCKREQITVPVELDGFIKRLVDLEVVSEEAPDFFDKAPTADC